MACNCSCRSLSWASSCRCGKSARWSQVTAARLRRGLRIASLGIFGLGGGAGCAETPTVQYSAAQLLGMWNDSMKNLADQHAGCPYERDLPFNHKSGACYPLKCKNSGDEASLLRKADGTVYKCDAGCNGGCSQVARF